MRGTVWGPRPILRGGVKHQQLRSRGLEHNSLVGGLAQMKHYHHRRIRLTEPESKPHSSGSQINTSSTQKLAQISVVSGRNPPFPTRHERPRWFLNIIEIFSPLRPMQVTAPRSREPAVLSRGLVEDSPHVDEGSVDGPDQA